LFSQHAQLLAVQTKQFSVNSFVISPTWLTCPFDFAWGIAQAEHYVLHFERAKLGVIYGRDAFERLILWIIHNLRDVIDWRDSSLGFLKRRDDFGEGALRDPTAHHFIQQVSVLGAFGTGGEPGFVGNFRMPHQM